MRSTNKDPVLRYACKTCGPDKFPPRNMPVSVGRKIMREHFNEVHANNKQQGGG